MTSNDQAVDETYASVISYHNRNQELIAKLEKSVAHCHKLASELESAQHATTVAIAEVRRVSKDRWESLDHLRKELERKHKSEMWDLILC